MAPKASAADQGNSRVYRVDERTRRAVNFFLVAIGGLFLSVTILYLAGVLRHRRSLGGILWTDLSMAALILLLGSGFNKRVVLHQDSIEVAGWFYSRKLSFAEIRGRQTISDSRLPYGYTNMLIPSDERKRKLLLPHPLQTDEFFRKWIESVPKLPR